MDVLNKFGTDPELEEGGVWITAARDPDQPDAPLQVRIARLGNPKYRKAYQRLIEQFRVDRTEASDADVIREVVSRACAEAVLLDWRNMELDGEPIEYNVENAYRILADPRLNDFRDWVVAQASSMERFRAQRVSDDAGKSRAS